MRVDRLGWLGIALLTLLAGGCAKLTFVEKSAQRRGYTQVAPEYDFNEKGDRAAYRDPAYLTLLALQAYRAGDPEAGELARKAIKLDPRRADAHNVLGLLADRAGDARTAGVHYKAAVDAQPRTGGHLNNYGTWLCGNGRAAESLGWFDRALADPAYTERTSALSNAGRCALRAGQPALAEQRLRAALELDPRLPQALAAMTELAYGAGRNMEARAFSERRLAAAAPDRESLTLAALIEDRLGDTQAASAYRAGLASLPPDPAATRTP